VLIAARQSGSGGRIWIGVGVFQPKGGVLLAACWLRRRAAASRLGVALAAGAPDCDRALAEILLVLIPAIVVAVILHKVLSNK